MFTGIGTAPLAEAVGWALFHSAWQLLVVAALLWGVLILQRSSSSLTRYWTSVGALLVSVVLPLLTGVGVLTRLLAAESTGAGLAANLPWVGWLPTPGTQAAAADSLSGGAAWSERIAAILPTLTLLWMVAVTVLSTRLVLSWNSVQRLRSRRTRRLPAPLTRRFYSLARELGVRGVRFLESRAVDVPMVVGWLSPVVLVPAAAVLRLTPGELEAVVAHELAHIRRRDYLVNLIQTVVETAFFFHPAVWWISNRIREERECCCDDTAVSTCGDPLTYARALTELESLRAGLPRLALGATGGVLLERVRRLVRPECRRSAHARRDLGGLVVLLSSSVLLMGTGLSMGAPGEEVGEGREPAPAPGDPRVGASLMRVEAESVDLDLLGGAGIQGRFQVRIEASDLGIGALDFGGPLSPQQEGSTLLEFEQEFEFAPGGELALEGLLEGARAEEWRQLVERMEGAEFEGRQIHAFVLMHDEDDDGVQGPDGSRSPGISGDLGVTVSTTGPNGFIKVVDLDHDTWTADITASLAERLASDPSVQLPEDLVELIGRDRRAEPAESSGAGGERRKLVVFRAAAHSTRLRPEPASKPEAASVATDQQL